MPLPIHALAYSCPCQIKMPLLTGAKNSPLKIRENYSHRFWRPSRRWEGSGRLVQIDERNRICSSPCSTREKARGAEKRTGKRRRKEKNATGDRGDKIFLAIFGEKGRKEEVLASHFGDVQTQFVIYQARVRTITCKKVKSTCIFLSINKSKTW